MLTPLTQSRPYFFSYSSTPIYFLFGESLRWACTPPRTFLFLPDRLKTYGPMFPGLAYQHIHRDRPHPKLFPDLARPGISTMPNLESPNARSKTITVADGPNTGGVSVFTQSPLCPATRADLAPRARLFGIFFYFICGIGAQSTSLSFDGIQYRSRRRQGNEKDDGGCTFVCRRFRQHPGARLLRSFRRSCRKARSGMVWTKFPRG